MIGNKRQLDNVILLKAKRAMHYRLEVKGYGIKVPELELGKSTIHIRWRPNTSGKLYDLLSREAAYNTIFIYQSIWPNLMWIHFAWTAQLTTTFSDNLENVFVLYRWLLAGNAQGHFFWPICLLLIVYLFLLLELFGNFTRRAFSGPSPLAIAYRQRLHLRT